MVYAPKSVDNGASLEVQYRKMSKLAAYALLAFIGGTVLVVCIRTFTHSMRNDTVVKCSSDDAAFIPLTEKRLDNFRRALQFRTVSRDFRNYDRDQLTRLGQFIVKAYPAIHSSPLVKQEFVANFSLLYTIHGSDPSLTPYLLASHLDVVPADDETKWDAPPFSAEVVGDFIYARGSIDDKHGVMGILESLEYLLSSGFQPRRSFYVAFGHDEEVTGLDGAHAIAETLKSRGLKTLQFLSDEGLCILTDVVPGISKPVALIGTSEKGQVVLQLEVKGETGHSSMPSKENSISILAKAIHSLEIHPHPSMFGYGPEKATFEHLASEMNIAHRVLMSNLWLFGPLVSWFMSRSPSTNAITRTVTAVTMFNSGIKANVIPPEAVAIVNHRIHPAQSVQEVIDYDRYVINDNRVKISIVNSMEPHPIAAYGDHDFGYQVMKNSIRQVWSEAAVAPGVLVANTDTRHYLHFTHNVYRFSPTFMYPGDISRFHGINERISKKNYEQTMNFYHHLILNADEPQLPPLHQHNVEL